MTTRGKWLLATSGVLVLTWSTLQLFLTHRLADRFYAMSIAGCARMSREHPGTTCVPLRPVAAGDWLPYAATSIVVLLALCAVAALLVRGGHRWSALLVTALPAANLLGGWRDPAHMLGAGWTQVSDNHLRTWTVAGAVVDTTVIAFVVVALVASIRPASRRDLSYWPMLRVVPPLVVLVGWWAMRHPLPDIVDKIWLLQAVSFVTAAGLLCTSRTPAWQRAVGVVVVLPLCSIPIYSEAKGFGSLGPVTHHALFAVGTAAMVVGLPRLLAWVRPKPTTDQPVLSG